jgi:ABC-type multidrug transport system permease subunit
MTSASGFLDRIAAAFSSWIGFGWLSVFCIWLAGTIFILRVVYRFFLERLGTRIPTLVIFVLWTVILMGIAGHYLGYGQPGGR